MAYTNLPLDEYQRLARRTEPAEVSKDTQKQLLNSAFGLMAEVGEITEQIKKHVFQGHTLNSENLLEEIGDSNWYLAQLCWSRTWPMGDLVKSQFVPDVKYRGMKGIQKLNLRLAWNAGTVASVVEQHLFGGEPLAVHSLRSTASMLFYNLEGLAYLLSSSGDRCRESNIAKLRIRYPQGFSAERSINREAQS